jgi:hypothetical protein
MSLTTSPHFSATGELTALNIHLTKESFDGLHTILHRALNCWAEAPPEFFFLADQLKSLCPETKLLPFNPVGTPKQRAD